MTCVNRLFVSITILLAAFQAVNCIKCYSCDSRIDKNCAPETTIDCPDGCLIKADQNGLITHGCWDSTQTDCKSPKCYHCSAEKCNKHLICKSCESSTDPDCAQRVNDKPINNQICPAENTQCFINIKADNHTERGCATTEQVNKCNSNKDTCKLCDTPNCNTEIFPKRPVCYKCTGSTCNNVTDSIEAKPCLLFEPQLKCYTIGSNATDMQRGCSSDDAAATKCKADDINCLTCDTDKCNNRTYSRIQAVKCEQCNSKDTPTCADEQKTDSAQLKNCQRELKYYEDDKCYTQTKNDITYRGCFYDRVDTSICDSSSKCTICQTHGCNKEKITNGAATLIVGSSIATLMLSLILILN